MTIVRNNKCQMTGRRTTEELCSLCGRICDQAGKKRTGRGAREHEDRDRSRPDRGHCRL